MIAVFRSTKYSRPQFSHGLAPVLVWLSGYTAVVVETVDLTLETRSQSLTLFSRSRALTLESRSVSLTLPERT